MNLPRQCTDFVTSGCGRGRTKECQKVPGLSYHFSRVSTASGSLAALRLSCTAAQVSYLVSGGGCTLFRVIILLFPFVFFDGTSLIFKNTRTLNYQKIAAQTRTYAANMFIPLCVEVVFSIIHQQNFYFVYLIFTSSATDEDSIRIPNIFYPYILYLICLLFSRAKKFYFTRIFCTKSANSRAK